MTDTPSELTLSSELKGAADEVVIAASHTKEKPNLLQVLLSAPRGEQLDLPRDRPEGKISDANTLRKINAATSNT